MSLLSRYLKSTRLAVAFMVILILGAPVIFDVTHAEAGSSSVIKSASCASGPISYDEVSFWQEGATLSGVKFDGGECTVETFVLAEFSYDSSQGQKWIERDGQRTELTAAKGRAVGTKLIIKYGRDNRSNGFDGIVRPLGGAPAPVVQAAPAVVYQPAPVVVYQPAPVVVVVQPAPAPQWGPWWLPNPGEPEGTCDIGKNQADRREMQPNKEERALVQPWVDEIHSRGADCHLNSHNSQGWIRSAKGDRHLGLGEDYYESWDPNNPSGGFSYELDAGYALHWHPHDTRPAVQTTAPAAPQMDGWKPPAQVNRIGPFEITYPDKRGPMDGSCTLPRSGIKQMDPTADGGTRMWQPWFKALQEEGGECMFFTGPTGGKVLIASGDLVLPPNVNAYAQFTPGADRGFAFVKN
jgi:hypothetical protein